MLKDIIISEDFSNPQINIRKPPLDDNKDFVDYGISDKHFKKRYVCIYLLLTVACVAGKGRENYCRESNLLHFWENIIHLGSKYNINNIENIANSLTVTATKSLH